MKQDPVSVKILDSLSDVGDHPWKKRTEWLEYDLALKWLAVEAYREDALAGFMHMIRHPEKPGEWVFCDVHTAEGHRRQGIAAAMYEEALNRLLRYGRAYCASASVGGGNAASVGLHRKMGFADTREAPVMEGFIFPPGETVYRHYFARAYPARNVPIHRRILSGLAGDRRDAFLAALERQEHGQKESVFILWAGEVPIGCRAFGEKGPDDLLLPEWKRRLEEKCLKIYGPDA